MNKGMFLVISVVVFILALVGIDNGVFSLLSWFSLVASGLGILCFSNFVFSRSKQDNEVEEEEVIEEEIVEEKKEEEVE